MDPRIAARVASILVGFATAVFYQKLGKRRAVRLAVLSLALYYASLLPTP